MYGGGRYAETRPTLPIERWAFIFSKHANDASLRQMAAHEAVSYEAIRQAVRRASGALTEKERA